MQLSIADNQLKIDLEFWERVWAMYFNADLYIPLDHIVRASTEKLSDHPLRQVRLPGTFLPGVIKAGTYYTGDGREFWYVNRSDSFLVLELENEFYKRIVLTVDRNQTWAEQINQQILV